MNIGIAPNKDGRLDEEDVKALKGFKTLRDAFFGECCGKCNVIVAWEDVSNGEISRDWTVKYKDKVVASGTTLGIKRIRVLDEAVPNNDLEWNSGNVDGTPGEGYSAYVRFYYADPELVKIVKSATTESGETDTAKWMMAGKQGATDESP